MKGIIFLGGAVFGGIMGYFATKRYYEQVLKEELEKSAEYHKKCMNDVAHYTKVEELYDDALTAFKDYAGDKSEVGDELYDQNYAPVEYPEEPYVITPEEYERGDNYAEAELTYYAVDGVLAREEWDEDLDETEIVTDIDSLIGPDALERIGEYEPDTVYVRNPITKTDYVIKREEAAYDE